MRPDTDVPSQLARLERPPRVLVTAGMPYANGPLHLGHLAGAQLPADIHARYWGLVIGRRRVLFVCGTDDHGSTSEVAALAAGLPVRGHVDRVHAAQRRTLERYAIGLDIFSGTSRPECLPGHTRLCQCFLLRLRDRGMLSTRASLQWYDPALGRFLPDRLVRGVCPNPGCGNPDACGDECDACGHQHEPAELGRPRSALSDAVPELRETAHGWLDMGPAAEALRAWIESKEGAWRRPLHSWAMEYALPSLRFGNAHEAVYKGLKAGLPPHRMKYAPGKQVSLQFGDRPALAAALAALGAAGVAAVPADGWTRRSITRDIGWGVPLPDLDPALAGKTLYVWPDSLIAPLSFTRACLAARGEPEEGWKEWWCDPRARVFQFIGQDNAFFYVLMQGALWLGQLDDPGRLPRAGELQLTDVLSSYHLLVNGRKMSKSLGNFYTGDQLLDEMGYEADQVRYYLALLGLAKGQADFDRAKMDERNQFLAGPLNSAFERPLAAAHSKFGGRVPAGSLLPEAGEAIGRILQRYLKSMERADYPNLLYEIENYARTINSLFTRYKPHDDRHDEGGRRDALFSCFCLLKSLMILLYPFVPATMERLRESLRLPPETWRIDEVGVPVGAGHALGPKGRYFPDGPAAPDPNGS